jgi:hypothetical protein
MPPQPHHGGRKGIFTPHPYLSPRIESGAGSHGVKGHLTRTPPPSEGEDTGGGDARRRTPDEWWL